MTKFLNLILVLLVFLSCKNVSSTYSRNAESFFTSVKKTDTLEMKLDIKSEEITRLEDLEARFQLKNITDKEVNYGFSSGCQYGYTVKENQNIIFDSRQNLACIAVFTQLKLKPNQVKTLPISLERFDINKELNKGVYELEAFLLVDNPPKISVFFKIE